MEWFKARDVKVGEVLYCIGRGRLLGTVVTQWKLQ